MIMSVEIVFPADSTLALAHLDHGRTSVGRNDLDNQAIYQVLEAIGKMRENLGRSHGNIYKLINKAINELKGEEVLATSDKKFLQHIGERRKQAVDEVLPKIHKMLARVDELSGSSE